MSLSRRHFLRTSAVLGAVVSVPSTLRTNEPVSAPAPGLPPLDRAPNGVREYELTIAETSLRLDGRSARATTINGSVPGRG